MNPQITSTTLSLTRKKANNTHPIALVSTTFWTKEHHPTESKAKQLVNYNLDKLTYSIHEKLIFVASNRK